MKKYSEMGDFEINKTVAFSLGSKISKSGFNTDYYFRDDSKAFNPCAPQGPIENFDPCNSWADAGPIIEQHNISLLCSTMCNQKAWEAMAPNGEEHWWEEKNPLRAAMIVFLMMKEPTSEC